MGEDNTATEQPQISIEDLAAQMLGLTDNNGNDGEEDEKEDEPQAARIHPAWQQILDSVPEEYHEQVIPTLQQWDRGVSRRFQRLHDEYAPYKEFEDLGPDSIKEAVNIYNALTTDPAATWEAIGRVYGLSPQELSQAASQDEDFDLDDLPAPIRERLNRLDEHDKTLQLLSLQMQQQGQAAEQQAEDEALEEYLGELKEEYGDFDEDYVVGLLASGMDGEDAVERFQALLGQIANSIEFEDDDKPNYPQVMSGGGGVANISQVDTSKMSNQDTQALIAEILRQSQSD